MVTCFIKGDSALYVLHLSNYMSLQRIVSKFHSSKIIFIRDKMRLNYKGIRFHLLPTAYYFINSLTGFQFMSNSFQIRFTVASNSLHTCLKFVQTLASNFGSSRSRVLNRCLRMLESLYSKVTGPILQLYSGGDWNTCIFQ